MKILICLVQNACRKKCCLLIQHVTFISMFALIKYIFDCLCLLSFFFFLFFFFCSYLFHLVDKHTGNLPLSGSDHSVHTASLALHLRDVHFHFLEEEEKRGKGRTQCSGGCVEEQREPAWGSNLNKSRQMLVTPEKGFSGDTGSRKGLKITWSCESRRLSVIPRCHHTLL